MPGVTRKSVDASITSPRTAIDLSIQSWLIESNLGHVKLNII